MACLWRGLSAFLTPCKDQETDAMLAGHATTLMVKTADLSITLHLPLSKMTTNIKGFMQIF